MSNFKYCKKVGTSAEDVVAGHLTSLGCSITDRPTARFDEYDMEVQLPSGEVVTIEVKYDKMQAQTGNLAIEYFNPRSNRPSGILSSLSDFWAFRIDRPEGVWLVCRKTLLNFISKVKPLRIIERAGDGNAGVMLYECEQILQLGLSMDDPGIIGFLEGCSP